MSTRWIKASHLALLVACFTAGRVAKTDFGSYRVELIVLLYVAVLMFLLDYAHLVFNVPFINRYARVIDLHNFEFVLANLTADEHAAVIARIGVLNLFNPWKQEGAIQLDLSRWEERQTAKILTHLAVIEPGENWIRL